MSYVSKQTILTSFGKVGFKPCNARVEAVTKKGLHVELTIFFGGVAEIFYSNSRGDQFSNYRE